MTQCKFTQRGVKCGESRDECHIHDACDGRSNTCHMKVVKETGVTCNKGLCHKGQCTSLDAQCQRIWGPGARDSPTCYKNNEWGYSWGNCGKNRWGYKFCYGIDVKCGTLHCQGVKKNTPVFSVKKAKGSTGLLGSPFPIFGDKIVAYRSENRGKCLVAEVMVGKRKEHRRNIGK